MGIIDRYVLREHLGPFLFATVLLTFILMMNQVIILFERVVGKGLTRDVIVDVFLLSVPFILATTVPMAVLAATLSAFGRLAADNEIVALQSSGVPLSMILRAPLSISLALCAALIWFNNAVLPDANHRLRTLLVDIALQKPTVEIQEGVFMDDFPGLSLLAEKVDKDRSVLHTITIYDRTREEAPRTILAKRGEMAFAPNQEDLILTLHDGEIHEVDPKNRRTYQRLTFRTQTLLIRGVGSRFRRTESDYRSDREMSAAMMRVEVEKSRREIARSRGAAREEAARAVEELLTVPVRPARERTSLDPAARARAVVLHHQTLAREIRSRQQRIGQYEVEIHKKYAIPAACFVFVLLGVPLRLRFRRGGVGIVIALSLAIFVVYYLCLTGGENLADRLLISPFWAMWAPNVLFGAAGLLLLLTATRPLRLRRAPAPPVAGTR